MPEVDPRSVIPVQAAPQQWPGANNPGFPVGGNPVRNAEQQRADANLGLAGAAGQRSQQALEMEAERLRMAQADYERKQKAAQLNGGAETTASQDQAAGHAIMLETNLRALQAISKRDIRALAPTWAEKAAKGLTNNDPDVVAWTQSGNRQVADAAYTNILDSAIWLATGAAAPEDQVKRINSLRPTMFDKPEVLAFKRVQLEAYIQQALQRAGPAQPKVTAAMETLSKNLDTIYGRPITQGAAPTMENTNQLSDKSQAAPLPKGMQEDYQALMSGIHPGQLTPEMYSTLREALYKKYGFAAGPGDDPTAIVDHFNKTGKYAQLTAGDQNLSLMQQALAGGSADKGAVGDALTVARSAANAGGLGLPELLAGQAGRAGMELADREHPKSAIAGDVLGSALPVVGLEGALAKAGMGKVAADMAANAGYGALRGANHAEEGSRLEAAGWGGGLGAGGSLVGRTLVKGARGFLGEDTQKAIDAMAPESFPMGGREPMPVDNITPVNFQHMSEEELQRTLADTRRQLAQHQANDAWYEGKVGQAEAEHDAQVQASRGIIPALSQHKVKLDEHFERLAGLNRQKQEEFLAEYAHMHDGSPEAEAALREMAEERFPTDRATLEKQADPKFLEPHLPDAAPSTFTPPKKPVPSAEPKDTLVKRERRLSSYLAQDPTVTQGTVPGVDLSTLQRAGLHNVEESFGGVPGIKGERERTILEFGRKNAGRVLAKIGQELPESLTKPAEIVQHLRTTLSAGYDKLHGQIAGRTDRQFANALSALRAKASAMDPDTRPMMDKLEATLAKFVGPDGRFDGKSYQEVNERLSDLAEDWMDKNITTGSATKVDYRDMARLAEKLKDQIEAQVVRSNSVIGKRLKNLNGAYAQYKRIVRASNKALKRDGAYAPDEYLQSIKDLDTSVDKTDSAAGKALDMEFARQAQDAIGNRPKETSKIFEQLLPVGALGYLNPKVAAGLGAVAGLGYTPGLKRLTQYLLTDGGLGELVDKAPQITRGPSYSDLVKAMIAQSGRAAKEK